MSLIFPERDRSYDIDSFTVIFHGQDGKTRVPCAISAEAMQDRFGAETAVDGKALKRLFDQHRHAIEEAASKKYDRGARKENGGVLLTATNFNY